MKVRNQLTFSQGGRKGGVAGESFCQSSVHPGLQMQQGWDHLRVFAFIKDDGAANTGDVGFERCAHGAKGAHSRTQTIQTLKVG